VWAATRAGNATAGSFGEYVNADAVRLSGDATAADNAEAFFDGTGYAGTNNVIPNVTTVTGNVNGNVGGSVASVTALAANSVNASALAADAVTEIQSGLATGANLATVDTVVDAIKAKTDSLTFTVAGQVDANVQAINDTAVAGDGSAGDPWAPV
jgi:ubiquinone biosynthesis protein UbiJ